MNKLVEWKAFVDNYGILRVPIWKINFCSRVLRLSELPKCKRKAASFLDIKVSIEGNGFCTSVYHKPTDSHSYLLYSFSHPSHVKNSILFFSVFKTSSFMQWWLRFFPQSESMCQFFEKRGYPASIVQAGHHRAQLIDRQSSLQASQKEHSDRIPFTLTFHPHNHSVKSIILKNFKLLQNDPETGTIFSQPPLISFKRDKNIGNILVRSSFQTNDQPPHF